MLQNNLIEKIGKHGEKCNATMDQNIASANTKSEIEDITDKICAENMS